MGRGLFITGTGTDVGKTYVTALLVKKLHESGLSAGYYKAALSGAESIAESDAGYVRKMAALSQEESTMVSYLYKNPVSPHLAAQWEGNAPQLSKILEDYRKVGTKFHYVTVEGSGGIVCPLCFEKESILLLEDVLQALGIGSVIVADAGLGTINATVLTARYLQGKDLPVRGIFLNRWTGTTLEEDNKKMVESLTGLEVLATVEEGAKDISVDLQRLKELYQG